MSNNCDIFNLSKQFKADQSTKKNIVMLSNNGQIGYSDKFAQPNSYSSHKSSYNSLNVAYEYGNPNNSNPNTGYMKLKSVYNTQPLVAPYSSRF